MWELVKRSLHRERTMTAAQMGRPRRASVQRMHNEIVEAFLKAGRQRLRRSATGRLGSVDSVVGDGVVRGPRSVRGGLWRAVSSLGLAIAMAIRLLNPYVLISVALGQRQSLLAHLSARVDSMRAVLSPRIGRRRRLTAWVQDTLPQRRVSEAASAVWLDGSLLCGIVEAAVPGSCPGYDSLSPPNADRGATLWLGQKLAARYLGVPPAFSDEEFSIPHLTIHMERRMLRYLSALKAASAKVEAECRRRQAVIESSGASVLQEDAFSLDTIANSSLPPGESLLECVARGMGLILGVQGRKSTFYLYLNPNHPHRHVHRLMRTSTLERQSSFDNEAGAILMQIRGPEGDFGATLLSTAPGSSSSTLGTSLDIMNENWYGRIPISYETTEKSVMVSYVPQCSGRHELILLQRGGSHVPGSPFSISVEESSEVPDDNGKLRRFGSEPVDGLLPAPKNVMTKATSYESGLDRGHRRLGSGSSDAGTKSEGDYPRVAYGAGKRRRVVARVVDFVTEKMLLTEDGKLERLPKRRKVVGRKEGSDERKGLLSEDDEMTDIANGRRYSTLYTSLSRVKHLEVDEPIHGTYPGRRSPIDFGKSETTYGISKSGLEMDTVSGECSSRVYKNKRRESEKLVRLSEIASHSEKESLDSINFREHCRRILWLCDILLKHSPRQESLEMLNTAGDILDGKRVHPTIMEESEPEDTSNATPPQSITIPQPAEPRDSVQSSAYKTQERRVTVSPPASKSLAQRLQREPSDTGGLNEVSAWKDGRRQFHSWTRKEKDGGGTVGGRLIHKGGSYRGVVVRDMTPEALSGAYTAGDELTEDEESQIVGPDDEDFTEVFPVDAASGMARHSLPKIRPPSLGKQMECRRASMETQERRSSASDREMDGGLATVSGKRLNQSNAPNDKGQINYNDRGFGRTGSDVSVKNRVTGVKASALRSGEGLEEHPGCLCEKEDKLSSRVARRNIVLAAAVALAEGDIKGSEEEPWEEPLSNIGTAAIPEKEEKNENCDKELMDPSSKGEPPPVQDHKGRNEEGQEETGSEEAASCGAEYEEEDEDARKESREPPSAESETCAAGEINEHPPTPTGKLPPSPPIHSAGAEQSTGSQEGEDSGISGEAKDGEVTESGYQQTISKKTKKEDESVVIKEEKTLENEVEGSELDENGVEMTIEEKKREEDNVNDEEINVAKNKKERMHSEPEVQKGETIEIIKPGVEMCEEENDKDRVQDCENLSLQTESEIYKFLEEGNIKESLLAAKESLKMGGDKDMERLEEKMGAVKEEEINEIVENFGQEKENDEENSVLENHKGAENSENQSKKFIKEGKESRGIEEIVWVKEDKEHKLLGSEDNVPNDAESKESEKSEVRENVEESNFSHVFENNSRNETERIEESIFEGDNQLVGMTEETYSVKETVVGDEDQNLESEMYKMEEGGLTQLQLELETARKTKDVTEKDGEENEEIAVEKVDTKNCGDGEIYDEISQETKLSEEEGKRKEGPKRCQDLKERDEDNLMPEKGTEAGMGIIDKDRHDGFLQDDREISSSGKEKRENVSDSCNMIEEKIAAAETEGDEMTAEIKNTTDEEGGGGECNSPKREESSQKEEITKESHGSEDMNPNLFRVDPAKKFTIGGCHEVLKLEDAFFTSAIGVQNTKECGNAHVIRDERERLMPCKDKGVESVPEGKINGNNVTIGPHVFQKNEGEREKEINSTEPAKEKSSEMKESGVTIKKDEIETKDEPGLGSEEMNKNEVGAINLKEDLQINGISKKSMQMQKHEETTMNENIVVGDKSSGEFDKLASSLIVEPKDCCNAFVEETLKVGDEDSDRRSNPVVEIKDLRENNAEKEKKSNPSPEIKETRLICPQDKENSREGMKEIVSNDQEIYDVEEKTDTKEESNAKAKEENKKCSSSASNEEVMDNVKEIREIDSVTEKLAIEKCVTEGEVRLKETVECEIDSVIRPVENTIATGENSVEEKRGEKDCVDMLRQSIVEDLERENRELTLSKKKNALEFEQYQAANMTEEVDIFRHDDVAFVDNQQNKHKNKDINNGRMVEGDINLGEMTENTLHKKLCGEEGVEIDAVKYEETSSEKNVNTKQSPQWEGKEEEDKIENTITGEISSQSENKLNIEQDFSEKRGICEDAMHVKEKGNVLPSTAQVEDNINTANEKSQKRDIEKEILGEISSKVNEIEARVVEPKLNASCEKQPSKREKASEQRHPLMNDEKVPKEEIAQSPNEKPYDIVTDIETNGKSNEAKELVLIGMEEQEKRFERTSLEINSMMESVKTAIFERTAVDRLIDFDIQTCGYTLGNIEQSIGKADTLCTRKRKEAEDIKLTETNPTVEFPETKAHEKGPPDSFHENSAADGVTICKPSMEGHNSTLARAEDVEIKKEEERGHGRGDGGKNNCEKAGSTLLEEEAQQVGKSSTEEPNRPNEEEGKVITAEAKSPTYGEIIGRILCTDSFPSESLEWFEAEGKNGEVVEGTMESMEEKGGTGEAVEAGTAVGDEVWELPEITREDDQPRETEGAERETLKIQGEEEEGGGVEQTCEGTTEGAEIEDDDQWSSGTQSNLEEEEEEEAGYCQEDAVRSSGGPSLRVGVGVVVAGGIVSRDSSRRDSNEGRDAAWRRSKWRASRSKSIEEGLPLPKEDPVGREWEEICMGIDAMEDGSISQVIAEVSGKRRRRRTRKERGDRSGKAMRAGYGRWARDETETTKEPPIPESQTPEDETVEGKRLSRLRPKGDGELTPAAVMGEEDEERVEKETSEGTGASREESPRVGIFGDPRWYSSSSWSSSLGGVKVEELRVDWVGAMEEGKRGRGPAEEEGVEAREDAGMEEVRQGAEEGERAKIFPGDKGVPFTEMTPPEVPRIKGSSAKDLEGPVVTSNRGIHLEDMAVSKGRGEKSNAEAIAEIKSSQARDTSLKCEGSHEAGKEKEVKAKKERKAENLDDMGGKYFREEDVDGEEMEEDEEDDVGEKVTKEFVSSHVTDQDLNETAGVKSDKTEVVNVHAGEESEEVQWSGERRDSKSMQPPKDNIFSKLENEHTEKEGGTFFGHKGSNGRKLTEAQSSGEWEFVDTGRHFAGNENSEEETFNESEGQFPRDNFGSESKGSFFHSFVGNRNSSQSLGVVGMGMELLHSLVDIPKGEETVSADGASPKREAEELFGVRMTLDDWDRKNGPNYAGPQTEVVVGELDLLNDWEHGVGRIGFIEVATDERQQKHLKDDEEIEMEIIEMEDETFVEAKGEKDGKQTEISHLENENESTIILAARKVISEDLESNIKQENVEEENRESTDDDDIEEIVRTEPDDWSHGTFTFSDSDHRSAFRNFEDLLGGDVNFRMTTCTAQFNLWPSEEAFGGKGTWMEHIDMDAFMSTAQSQPQSGSGKGLLESMTTFAKTCVVGDEKGSTTTREQYYFTKDSEGRVEKKGVNTDGDEEEIVLVEQDFDDRSDEIEGQMEFASPWESTYQSFDISHRPNISKGDAFAIFESPGVTTRAARDDEQLSGDEGADDEIRSDKNQSRATLCDSDEMEMLDLSGDWEESVVFLDDEDEDIDIGGRRGSGEYRKFGGDVEGRVETDLWGIMTTSNVDSCVGDTAFAIVMDSEDIKEKTPVLPTGRWCPRLPLLSPAMSAISEEESEEIYPEKYDKQDEESGSFQTDNEWDNQSSQEKPSTNEVDDVSLPVKTVLWDPSTEDEERESSLENVTGENLCQPVAVTLIPDDTDTKSSPAESLDQDNANNQLPKLDVEVEDGFGQSFSRRRSSSSSVLSDTTTADPMADCGAAFVVSSELAVALALGVSITQIIPPTMDQPEIPPLPQVELATDALRAGHANEKEKRGVCKGSEEEQIIYSNENRTAATDISLLTKNIQSSIGSIANADISKEIDIDLSNSKDARKKIPITMSYNKGRSDVSMDENYLGDFDRLGKKKIDKDESLRCIEAPECGKENSFGRRDDVDFFFPERNVSWYDENGEGSNDWWSNESLITQTLTEKEEMVNERTECVTQERPKESEKENNTAAKVSIDFFKPELNVIWYDDDEEDVVDWWSKEWLITETLTRKKEITCEKTECVTQEETRESVKEYIIAGKDSVDFLFPERNVNWYDDDQEEVDELSNGRLRTGTFAEKEKVDGKKIDEEKVTAFVDKDRCQEKEQSVDSGGKITADFRDKKPAESKGKSSPPSGARKKESPDKKTRDSPAKPIPVEKLLGWPSENGNSNGIGCSGIASRRESVFDDYNFSLWENGFKLNRDDDKDRGSKRQDSTGLEYYLDVDQLLNVPLAATEPEVKYVSAKEIMDTFTRGMDSPEKSSDKESKSEGEKASKSDSLDDSLLGATGGASIGFIDEGLVDEAAGSSQTVIETKHKVPDLWSDDLFVDACQSKTREKYKMEPMDSPLVITALGEAKYISSLHENRKVVMPDCMPEGDRKFEKKSIGKIAEKCAPDNESEKNKKDAFKNAGAGDSKRVKATDYKTWGDQKQDDIISKKYSDTDTKTRSSSSRGKVRNMIGIFEQQPASTKSPTREELSSHEEGKVEKRTENTFQEMKTDDTKCVHRKLEEPKECETRLEVQEPIKMLAEEEGASLPQEATPVALSCSLEESVGGRYNTETVRSTQLEELSLSNEIIIESGTAEHLKVQKENLIDTKETQLTERRTPTLEDKRDEILSLTEEPVVGWEAIKVATEVENIILSTGNGIEQKKKVMGEVIIVADPDKKSVSTGVHAKEAVNTSETEDRRKQTRRESYSNRRESGSMDKAEELIIEEDIGRSARKEESLASGMEHMSKSSSFEEYKSVVSEAYQFLEALGDTIDEDDEEQGILPGEEAKVTGGKAEESVGGLGSEVEDYHPCEELPGGERETIPRGVEGAPTKGGQAEAQSSPSSPERCKTTESSTSSSPYSSLPTFADISSGILSSASSKDESSLKTEDGKVRAAHKMKDSRGAPKAEADRTTDGAPGAGDILDEEMDSITLAKMNVASRKEYWDRRLQRAQEKSKEPVTVGSKPSPLRFSGIVARGRMSFEKSKDYSTSDSGGDGGKSSSESSPTSKGKHFSQRPKAVYSKGAKSIWHSKQVAKAPEEEVVILPSEEIEPKRTMDEHSCGSVARVKDEIVPKEIRIPLGEEKVGHSRKMGDTDDLSQISVSKRKEIWNQKVQKMSEDDSPPSSLEYKRMERRKSSRVESAKPIVTQSSTEDKSERGVTSIRNRGVLPKYRQELEEQSLSIDSSSVDDKVGKDLGVKKPLPKKTGGSVSQLAKLFSSPPPEPPPIKYRGGRPITKVKYSRNPKTGSLSFKDESVKEPRCSAESSSSAASAKAKFNVKTSAEDSSITESRSPSPGEILVKRVSSDDKSEKKIEEDRRKTSFSPTSKSPWSVGDKRSFRTDSESSEIDNLASRRQKYLESVQQSLEGDEGRHEGTLKKSESEDSMTERMAKKAISDVRNIWEKRASLDGSSSSESMKRPVKVGTILPSTISNRKKVAQGERPATKATVGQSERVKMAESKGESHVAGSEGKGKVDILLEKAVSLDKVASSAVSPSLTKEEGQKENEHLPHTALACKEASLDAGKDSEPHRPSPFGSTDGIVTSKPVKNSILLHEERPPLKDECDKAIIQEKNLTAQLIDAKIEKKIDFRDSSSEGMAKEAEVRVQLASRVAQVETPSEVKFVVQERVAQDQPKSPYGRGFPQEREVRARAEVKVVATGESTAPSIFKGRRHSCTTVASPPKKVNLSKTREKCGSVEEKMLEFHGQKVKRDSLEIRVTDDEDVCVMREVTSVPRFALKEKKMETHAEEDVDNRQASGRKVEVNVAEENDGHKTPSPTAKGAAKRRSLPQRTLSIQVSGIVASGRRRFESGKAVLEDMPTLAEEIAETANKSKISPGARRSPEERKESSGIKDIEEEEEDVHISHRGLTEVKHDPKVTKSNERELYRAVPANVMLEGEQRLIGREGVRSEARPSSEDTSPASRGGEGGNDGHSTTSRRASKGKAPPPARQPPPSAASSPDSESEGAAEAKLRGFLSTPAAQARRHSAVDVAALRSFATTAAGEGASGGPRMRRRGSGDLGSPSRLKNENESKKRFTRARQFFETLERGKDSPPSPPQSAAEDASSSVMPLKPGDGKKKKLSREDRTPLGTSSLGRRTGGTKYRPPIPKQAKDSSGSTTDSDKERKHRRKVRRTPSTHSAPGSDMDSSGSTPLNHPSLHRRKRDKEFVLRSQRFGGSEREVRVSERFNVMDLFRDVAGPGNGMSSGRATPLGIPHQAAVLAALRSVEDVRSCETTSPYDMYRPVEADNDCEPSASGTNASASASTNASANASGAEDEAEGTSATGGDESANPGVEDDEGNVTFGSLMTMCVKKEYQAEYPHLPITSPRHSRHRSSNTDLIPRNVLLQRDANENSPGKSTASRRSIAEMF